MYNGIGLKTQRGSGTNGYVTKSFADVRNTDERRKQNANHGGYRSGARRRAPVKQVDQGVADHHRRRQIEVQLAEMRDRWEDSGVPDNEIDRRIDSARQDMVHRFESDKKQSQRDAKEP